MRPAPVTADDSELIQGVRQYRTTLQKQADLAGREGVAVSLLSGPVRFDYIFDAKTYEFLGERVVVVGHLPPYPKGVVSRWTAQLRITVVDRAGQLP
ncbi:hypothetical protein ACIA5C_16300 [Actinoplanes sp. NPDC051343]|uniref:hypothetical protein n=1 Tax=Actinoplanes sp. NPDC051343 TaxID=3363906 RepID=UPI0037A3EE7C